MNLPKRILVPVDLSPCSRTALNYAIALARPLGASIDVLNTFETPPMVAPDLVINVPGQTPQTVDAWVAAEAKKGLDTFLAEIFKPEGLVIRSHTEPGAPRPVILAYAEKHLIDLIVMGTHGRTGVSHLVMGSVAEGIVRTAPVPVLTVRHTGK